MQLYGMSFWLPIFSRKGVFAFGKLSLFRRHLFHDHHQRYPHPLTQSKDPNLLHRLMLFRLHEDYCVNLYLMVIRFLRSAVCLQAHISNVSNQACGGSVANMAKEVPDSNSVNGAVSDSDRILMITIERMKLVIAL